MNKAIFLSHVERTDECWLWNGSVAGHGYGQFYVGNGHRRAAHRVMYELLIGEIPDGMTLDHLCRNRRCVRPSHLEPVTNKENILRGTSFAAINAKKTHCPKGHALDEANTFRSKKGRECRRCKHDNTIASHRRLDRLRGITNHHTKKAVTK